MSLLDRSQSAEFLGYNYFFNFFLSQKPRKLILCESTDKFTIIQVSHQLIQGHSRQIVHTKLRSGKCNIGQDREGIILPGP